MIAIADGGAIDPNLLAHRALDAVLETRPSVHPLPALPDRAALAPLAGRGLEPESGATLEIAVPEGVPPSLTTHGMTAEATADGRLASPRFSNVFLGRGLDAGTRSPCRHVAADT